MGRVVERVQPILLQELHFVIPLIPLSESLRPMIALIVANDIFWRRGLFKALDYLFKGNMFLLLIAAGTTWMSGDARVRVEKKAEGAS